MSDLDQVRSEQRGIIRVQLMNRIGFQLDFDIFEFTLLNNQLIQKGYVITEDNREEKYLQIINDNDQEDIDLLTRFLEALDRISPHMFFYKQYSKASKEIDEASDEERIKNIVEEHLKIYH